MKGIDLCGYCGDQGHTRDDHARPGPKPPHARSALSGKQLAASIRWATYPDENGPYTYFPTTEKAYCDVALCSCVDFVEPEEHVRSKRRKNR